MLADLNEGGLLSSSFVAFFVRLCGAISAFLGTFVIAKSLGAGESGYYFLAFSIVAMFSAVGRSGLDNTILRFVGGAPELVISILKKSVLIVVILSGSFVLVFWFFSELISEKIFLKPQLAPVLKVMSVGILALSLVTILAMALQGLRKAPASIVVLNIAPNILLVSALVLFGISSARSLASVYVLVLVAVAVGGGAALHFYTKNIGSRTITWASLFASCFPLWIVAIMDQSVQWSGQFIAGMYVDSGLLAQYAVAQRVAMLSSFVLIAVNLVIAPQFAVFFRERNFTQLETLSKRSVKLVAFFSIPVIGTMLVFPSFLMSLFGDEFIEGALLLQILAVGQFVNAMTGSVGFLLMMSGFESDMRNCTLISGSLALFLSFTLTSLYGVVGAAIATAIAVAAQNLLAVYFVKRRLGFNTLAIWR
ncbi:MAG: O-antigen/teichoic acid export membrane protein [Zhongshania aliphaticivorans]|jgi:O-antigen/teichoic acid export membrane protein